LKTVDPTPGNLRPPTTSFIGRESELAELESVLKAHRLVTLTGVGGVGKTRLAMELAVRLADTFPDGVFVIELAAVGDPAAVPEAAAAVLGVTQQPGLSVAESVAAPLEGIPLGIELAASRLQSMTVTDVRDRLDDRFRLLVGSRRAWNAIKPCAMPCSGPSIYSTTPKSLCCRRVPCSLAGSTLTAPAP